MTDAFEIPSFESIKAHRGNFFVEYFPPNSVTPFAWIHLTFIYETKPILIPQLMENELKLWLMRYPIAAMVSAFNSEGDLISLNEVREESHLVGWMAEDGTFERFWRGHLLSEHVKKNPFSEDLKKIYFDVPFKTKEQIQSQFNDWVKTTQTTNARVKIVLYVWLIAIPIGIALIEYFSPEWLSLIALAYSFWKGAQKWRELTGRSKKSPAQIAQSEKEQKMRHYYYHCELNPTGFAALRSDNLRNKARESIKQESATLLGNQK